ncbi:Coiled-coil domain-containing protein 58 [Mactra antiquata]
MAASMESDAVFSCPCDDIMQFEDALKKSRVKDDKIINELNEILPTQSFEQKYNPTQQCKSLYEQMTVLYNGRENAIKKCVKETATEVDKWRARRLQDRDDQEAINMLRKSQTNFRLIERELGIEQIIKDRSFKTFYERCRNYYTPPNRPIV